MDSCIRSSVRWTVTPTTAQRRRRTCRRHFKPYNSCEAADCTAMKTKWVSEADTAKKAESAMVCLKSKLNASQDGLGRTRSVETRVRSLSRAGSVVMLDWDIHEVNEFLSQILSSPSSGIALEPNSRVWARSRLQIAVRSLFFALRTMQPRISAFAWVWSELCL